MKFSDLSAEDQALLNTDLGEFEKDAAVQVQLAQEMYASGFDKMAVAMADQMDKLAAEAEESEKEEDKEEDEGEEKKAAVEEFEKMAEECGAFIERGVFDGLCKLGQERHGDAAHYLYPYVAEKVAAETASKVMDFLRRHGNAAKAHAGKAWEKTKAAPGYVSEKLKRAATGRSETGRAAERSVKKSVSEQAAHVKKLKDSGASAETIKDYEEMAAKGNAALKGKKDVSWKERAATGAAAVGTTGGIGGLGYLALRKKKHEGEDK